MKLQKVVYCLKKAVNVHTAFDDQQAVEALNTAIALIESEIDKQKSTVATKTHVRDRCDPLAVHRALLALQEYRAGIACDMPEAAEAFRKHGEPIPTLM